MQTFSNHSILDAAAFGAWLSASKLSRRRLEAEANVPRRYWTRWTNGTRITARTRRRLEEVGVPAAAFVPATAFELEECRHGRR